MEGERAQRSEAQRKLREVEKALASIRNPEWWGPTAASLVRWVGGSQHAGWGWMRLQVGLVAMLVPKGRELRSRTQPALACPCAPDLAAPAATARRSWCGARWRCWRRARSTARRLRRRRRGCWRRGRRRRRVAACRVRGLGRRLVGGKGSGGKCRFSHYIVLSCRCHLSSHLTLSNPLAPAADAKRWNGVRSVVQARALLKSLFRSASQHKAQASRLGGAWA